eukprot:TRINITY_DN4936_c0_g1_i1.p1 TRINITY_DN4936_c0_g1~~TRINITY_DN4936_c0_g1_i1.p1  ORF type:complete len:282 (-),score=48.44 TRINITY_DN4936_c0_g1_i1:52-867(-)
MLKTLIILFSFLSFSRSQSICKVAWRSPEAQNIWDFSNFYEILTEATQEVNFFNNPEVWSFRSFFCDGIDVITSNISRRTDRSEWMGWYHGKMSKFEYLPQYAEGNQKKQGPILSFRQSYLGGDRGYPCRTSTGRNATVDIYCGSDFDSKCPNNQSCLSSNSDDICICSVSYDAELTPCQLTLVLGTTNCPQPDIITTPTLKPYPPSAKIGPSAGEIFWIIFLAVFLIAVALFLGTYIYNVKKKGLEGVNAFPFVAWCRGVQSEPSFEQIK